jgi:hypothetical protein
MHRGGGSGGRRRSEGEIQRHRAIPTCAHRQRRGRDPPFSPPHTHPRRPYPLPCTHIQQPASTPILISTHTLWSRGRTSKGEGSLMCFPLDRTVLGSGGRRTDSPGGGWLLFRGGCVLLCVGVRARENDNLFFLRNEGWSPSPFLDPKEAGTLGAKRQARTIQNPRGFNPATTTKRSVGRKCLVWHPSHRDRGGVRCAEPRALEQYRTRHKWVLAPSSLPQKALESESSLHLTYT